ncbi:MAG: Ig-like domain repeat protein [Nocardioides sp.]
MTVRSSHLKLVGALGAAALTVGAIGAASPALAAGHDLTYQCTGQPVPLQAVDTTLNPGAIPAKMTAGQSVKNSMSLVVHLNQTQTGIAQAAGDSVDGKVVAKGPLAFKLNIPNTAIDQTLGATQDVTASGKGTITAAKAGKFKVNAGAINATLNLTRSGNTTTATQDCTAPTDGTQTLATVTVAKDKTKSKVSAKGSGGKATVTDKVKSHFGLVPTGKVKFTLKKGSKSVTAKGSLNKKGVAKISRSLSAGKYSITAKYAGDKNVKGSTGKGSVTVK